jgi:molybdenum cofactor synthesis domain-containing protein
MPEARCCVVPEYDLFDKTELTVRGISLENVNLDHVAKVAADAFDMNRGDLLVTDVLGDHLVIDILRKGLDPHAIVGKKDELLRGLSALPGVNITENTSISSKGMLGWIALSPAEGKKILETSETMSREISKRLKRTALVFSTGAEVAGGQVMDTNAPAIRAKLSSEGYTVKFGDTLKDDEVLISARLRMAADDGYGLVVITGGVGAEEKDRTIESVLMVDPQATTPAVVKYELGVGRHKHKDSVRIAVGNISGTLIVALPGPNDEVQSGLQALVEGLDLNESKERLADRIADRLRERLKEKAHG